MAHIWQVVADLPDGSRINYWTHLHQTVRSISEWDGNKPGFYSVTCFDEGARLYGGTTVISWFRIQLLQSRNFVILDQSVEQARVLGPKDWIPKKPKKQEKLKESDVHF